MTNPDEVGAAAVDYLRYSGYAVSAWLWARMALTAERLRQGTDPVYAASKIDLAKFYYVRILPRMISHRDVMLAGGDTLMHVESAVFVADH